LRNSYKRSREDKEAEYDIALTSIRLRLTSRTRPGTLQQSLNLNSRKDDSLTDRMLFRIRYTTRYAYEQPASDSRNELRVCPSDSRDQKRLDFRLQVTPSASISEHRDDFGNLAHSVSVAESHNELTIVADSIVHRIELPPERGPHTTFSEYLGGDAARTEQYGQFLRESRYVPFSPRLRTFFWSARPSMEEDVTNYTERMISYVRGQFGYDRGTTHVHSTVDDILSAGGGVCQDFAHLNIGLLRLAGIPTRYVSGYVAPRLSSDPNRPPVELASHAWIEVMLPGVGWSGFDPTYRSRTTAHHINVAVGRDYSDVPPVCGFYKSSGGHRKMTLELRVEQTNDPELPPAPSTPDL
jgi:transglutaminase-like putative cysteine protease